jgi:hypothetical protein
MHINILHVRRDLMAQLPANLLADALDFQHIVVALCGEAVDMDHGQLLVRMWSEHLLDFSRRQIRDVGVETDKRREESNGRGRQVHDVMGEEAGLDKSLDGLGLLVLLGVAAGEFGLWVDGYAMTGIVKEEIGRCLTDESTAVGVEGADKVANLVDLDICYKRVVGLWVEVVGPYEALFLARGHGKRADACHDVAYGLTLFECVAEAFVLGVQTCVPVDLGKIEFKGAALLAEFDVHVVRSVQDLVLECSEGILCPHIVELVDDSLDHGVLVGEHGGNEVLVWPVPLAQVQVGNMAGEGKALGDLVIVLGLWRGDGGARNLRVGEVVVVEVQLVGYYAQCAVLLEVAQLRGPCGSICLVSDSALGCPAHGG